MQAPHFCAHRPDQGCGDGRQGPGTTSRGLSVPVTRVGTAAGLPAGHRLLGWFRSPCPPMPGRTQWGEGSNHTRSSPPVGLPEGGDLTEVQGRGPGSCGCYSCPGGSLSLLWGSLALGGPVPLPGNSPFPLTPESAQILGSTQMRLFRGCMGSGVGLPLSKDPGHTRRVLSLSP